MRKEFEYTRVGCAVPKISIGNPIKNVDRIIDIIMKAKVENDIDVLVFPELSITGYTCGDLFNQKALIKGAEIALEKLLECTIDTKIIIAVGMPVKADNQLFNCGVVIYKGNILGVVPKTYIPNYNEFYEKRNFASSLSRISDTVHLCGKDVPFGENLLFKDTLSNLCIGLDICEDLWVNIPPSSYHTLYGANLILNLSASNETVGKAEYRRELVKSQSARCITAYAYASAGECESTTDVVFSGHSLISENGTVLEENRFGNGDYIIYSDVDIDKLNTDRIKFNSYMGKVEKIDYKCVEFHLGHSLKNEFARDVNPTPFVPSSKEDMEKRCEEIINIQSTGLSQRLRKTGIKKAVLGISGGLDSTLALLVTIEAFKKIGMPLEDIIAVTMPGFGTTGRTYNNSISLMKALGVTFKEISIKDSCIQHYKDIDHDINVHDITYENVQARERTQILMDLANKVGGIVVGTGDLSELALGWCTYNGDHMSMYGVNGSIPKTLVKYIIKWYAESVSSEEIRSILEDILDTPVSPELLPPDKDGNMKQITENSIGSYELHDFFLYHMIRNGYEPSKILFLAQEAFRSRYESEVVIQTLKTFYKRFFTQQFKRSCMPDGVKVGSVALSPRGDWRMPSDCSYELWLTQL